MIVANIRDRFDHVFYFPDEVKQNLNQPLLGHIPFVKIFENVRKDKSSIIDLLTQDSQKGKKSSTSNSYEMFFYTEAFRNLYNSIPF